MSFWTIYGALNGWGSFGTAATVYPNGDGSIGDWTDETGVGTTNLWSHVDEAVASPTDADYIACSTISTASAIFLLLEDMPSDFASMGGTIVVRFRGRHTSGEFGPVGIFQSDETTALTDTERHGGNIKSGMGRGKIEIRNKHRRTVRSGSHGDSGGYRLHGYGRFQHSRFWHESKRLCFDGNVIARRINDRNNLSSIP